jgi:hypothetical protein
MKNKTALVLDTGTKDIEKPEKALISKIALL